jgi:hypothetical protein
LLEAQSSFIATLSPVSGRVNMSQIILTAKEGFTFNDYEAKSIESVPFTVNDKMEITARTNLLNANITEEDIAKFHPNGTIDINNFEIIQKLFKLPAEMKLPQAQESFKATLSPISGITNMRKVTLTANLGFVFNDSEESSIESGEFLVNVNLPISEKDLSLAKITTTEILSFGLTSKVIEGPQVEIINRIFNIDPSITTAEQMNNAFEIKRSGVSDVNKYTLTLTAKTGFLINGKKSLISNPITANTYLQINPKDNNDDNFNVEQVKELVALGIQPINDTFFGIINLHFELNKMTLEDAMKAFTIKFDFVENPGKH